ncbi:TetR/AcrR family transcriptional regulator [Salipiger sp.]|uniref:TetR/AcrR family transcriptional regulator n=1 Tax=Salipiger sp. TaxID=2078585 RepID=UPI003A973E07
MAQGRPRSSPGRPPTIEDPQGTIRLAAARLFAENGYGVTSLQDVAGAVGMTKAGLYHYFPTKQALFDAIVLSTLTDLIRGAEAVLADTAPAPDKLRRFMLAHAGFFAAHGDRYKASFFGSPGLSTAAFTGEQLALRRAYVRILETLIEDGTRSGALQVDDVPVLARGILGMLNWMARWYRPDGPKPATEIAGTYADIVLAGILPR